MTEPKRLGTKCQTQAVAIKWAAAADGLEANDADGKPAHKGGTCHHGGLALGLYFLFLALLVGFDRNAQGTGTGLVVLLHGLVTLFPVLGLSLLRVEGGTQGIFFHRAGTVRNSHQTIPVGNFRLELSAGLLGADISTIR